MAIDGTKLKEALTKGFNVICATCQHHWDGVDKGRSSCGDKECGGPVSGKEFPNYKGDIIRERFDSFCICCLKPELKFKIAVNGKAAFGLCALHEKAFHFLKTGDALTTTGPLLIPV